MEFLNDTMSHYLRAQRVPFLSKYGEMLQGAYNIVPLREFLVEIIKECLGKSTADSQIDEYKPVVAQRFEEAGLNNTGKTIDIIAAAVLARREELRKVLTDAVLKETSDLSLIDYNYNIELVMSSNASQKVQAPMMTLELFLRVNVDELGETHSGKDIQRVVLELSLEEA